MPVVNEVLEVFLEDLPRLRPDRKNYFFIEVFSSTAPISKA